MKTKWFGRSGLPIELGELSMRQLRTRAACLLLFNDGKEALGDVREVLDHIDKRYSTPTGQRRMRVIDGDRSG